MKLVTEGLWHVRSDENVVEGRIVPFGEPAFVYEEGELYREGFDAGSLTRMEQVIKQRGNATWVGFNLEHDESFVNKIGYMRSLEQRDDGAWAEFKLYPSTELAKVRAMLEESHTGLSVKFDDITPPREGDDGVRWRTQVHVSHVAATPMPVYEGATITKVRDTGGQTVLATPALDQWSEWIEKL
jgi:phage head maturation protease